MLRDELQLSDAPLLRSIIPQFHSQVLGVDPAHAELAFYSSVLERDAPRIQKLFAQASSAGIPLQQHHVPLDRLCDALARRESIFIVLVDVRPLKCARCTLGAGHFRWSYSGHYILLTGYSYEADAFTYMDPAVGHGTSGTSTAPSTRLSERDGTSAVTADGSKRSQDHARVPTGGSLSQPAALEPAVASVAIEGSSDAGASGAGSTLAKSTPADAASAAAGSASTETDAASGGGGGGIGAALTSFLRYVAGSIGLASSSASGSSSTEGEGRSGRSAAATAACDRRRGSPHCVIRARDLELARTARGTDEDIIEIPLAPLQSPAVLLGAHGAGAAAASGTAALDASNATAVPGGVGGAGSSAAAASAGETTDGEARVLLPPP